MPRLRYSSPAGKASSNSMPKADTTRLILAKLAEA